LLSTLNNIGTQLINPEVRIETTNLCNAQCTICNHNCIKRRKGVMTDGAFKKLVKQSIELGAKLISPFGFGEPLLDKTIDKKIEFCTKLGRETFITSNGSLCHSGWSQKLFDAGLTHIRFSVHGINKVDYENVHKSLTWMHTLMNIFTAINIREVWKYNTKISVSVIPMHGESVEDVRKFWEGVCDELEIWKPHNWSIAKDYRNRTVKRKKTCGRPERGPVQIQWDGKIIPCCFITDAEIVLGDTTTTKLRDILEGDAYQELRRKHREGDLKGLPCEHCDQLNIEDESPLLYSTIDKKRTINCTSSAKYKIL